MLVTCIPYHFQPCARHVTSSPLWQLGPMKKYFIHQCIYVHYYALNNWEFYNQLSYGKAALYCSCLHLQSVCPSCKYPKIEHGQLDVVSSLHTSAKHTYRWHAISRRHLVNISEYKLCNVLSWKLKMTKVTAIWVESTHNLTLQSAVSSKGYILKCSVPSRSNLHFKFLTFGHSGAQGWAPECPNVRILKWRYLNGQV